MTQVARDGDRTVWVTRRDEQMIEWFSIVRVTNMQTIRWVLGALNGADGPVSLRQAQSWCTRMKSVGVVDVKQVGAPGGSVVWAASKATGQSKPDLLRQTTRHEIAVSAVSARYAVAGYAWQRDEKAPMTGGHQADGVALGVGWVELIEVELTAKRLPRYASIFGAYRLRLQAGDADQLTYLCTAAAARGVQVALETLPVGRSIADRVLLREVFDGAGVWSGEQLPGWLLPVEARISEPALG